MTDRRLLPLVLVLALLSALGFGSAVKPPHAESGDAPDYLNAAYHLLHHRTFSEAWSAEAIPPAVGREPGYAVFLAGLMALDAGLGRYTPDCLTGGTRCPPEVSYRVVQWTNPALTALAGLALYGTVRLMGGTPLAAATTALLVVANNEMLKSRHYVLSDYLALALLALTMLAAAWTLQAPQRTERWAVAGLLLAALTLTKAVFLIFALLLLALPGPWLLWRQRSLLTGLAALALAWGVPVAGWMARNAAVEGNFALTQSRAGIALSTREVFNHLTPEQYQCAFVYWTRGFGDDLARRRFAPEVWQPFGIDRPGGFYDVGQNRYQPWVARLAAERGLEPNAARAEVDRKLRDMILEHPLEHLAATLPVFYRGIWIDEFIAFTLPALLGVSLWALWRRRWGWVLLLAPGWFNLLFYALVSLNIPRYQITAVPALALAGGLAVQAIAGWFQKRRSA